jgi:hypothetical protein
VCPPFFSEESERIQQCGGKVICKSGVPRVVWNRPKMGHKGPVRRSTHIDEIPFLAVARSLGDLWSYNSEENVFVVSPEPDIRVYPVDISKHRCLILGTDGAWNMLTPQNAISTVCQAEKANEAHMLNPSEGGGGGGGNNNKSAWINPSKQLVDTAIERWNASKLRADNTSVVTVMLDPPGPPRAQVLKTRKRELAALNAGRDLPNPNQPPADRGSVALVTNTTPEEDLSAAAAAAQEQAAATTPGVRPVENVPLTSPHSSSSANNTVPKPGCSIISRFPNSLHPVESSGYDLFKHKQRTVATSVGTAATTQQSAAAAFPYPRQTSSVHSQQDTSSSSSSSFTGSTGRLTESTQVNRGGPALASRLAHTVSSSSSASATLMDSDSTVQCNEISSSEDTSPRSSSSASSQRSSSPEPELGVNSLPSSSQQPASRSAAALAGKVANRKSLARELSALRLSTTPSAATKTRTASAKLTASGRVRRSRPGAGSLSAASSSDTENMDSPSGRIRTPKTATTTTGRRTAASSGVVSRDQSGSAPSLRSSQQAAILPRSAAAKGGTVDEERLGAEVGGGKQPSRAATAPLRQQQQQHSSTRSAAAKAPSNAALVRKHAASLLSPTLSSPAHSLRSAESPAATPLRSLRTRGGVSNNTPAAKTPLSGGGMKRRRPLSECGGAAVAAKSPRTAVVSQKPPVVHRSRQARVLRLKK